VETDPEDDGDLCEVEHEPEAEAWSVTMDKSTLQTMSAIDIKRQDHIWGNSSRPLSICLCLSDCLCLSVCLSLCLCPPYFASPVLADRAKRSLTTTNFVQRSLSVDGRITCNQR